MLLQLGEEAKLLAGGQSLIPLMKLRFASPKHLVDLNFISGTSYIKEENGALRFGALTRSRRKFAVSARKASGSSHSRNSSETLIQLPYYPMKC